MLQRIASVIHPSVDVEADRAFWTAAIGVPPYFDEPFYVGFRVGETELGLDPHAAEEGLDTPVVYWEVADITAALDDLTGSGARGRSEVRDVGGLLMATFEDPSGATVGVLQRAVAGN